MTAPIPFPSYTCICCRHRFAERPTDAAIWINGRARTGVACEGCVRAIASGQRPVRAIIGGRG